MNWEKLNQALTNTVSLSAMIFLSCGAKLFSRYFVLTYHLNCQIGLKSTITWLDDIARNLDNLVFLVFIDAMALILLSSIFVPIISSLGYDQYGLA